MKADTKKVLKIEIDQLRVDVMRANNKLNKYRSNCGDKQTADKVAIVQEMLLSQYRTLGLIMINVNINVALSEGSGYSCPCCNL